MEISAASNGNITDVSIYVDGEARMGDKVYVVVPLNSCRLIGSEHDYQVGFDNTKLKYLTMLPQSHLHSIENLPITDAVAGLPLYETVDFTYDWNTYRDDVAAVIEFEVLTDEREPVPLKFYKSDIAYCDSNAELLFSTISGPYDPNYKESDISEINVAEMPMKKVNPTEVLYTIHFQNIGNAPVDSVTIFDVLPDYLTFTSFEGSSEPNSIVNTSQSGNTLKWIIAQNADIKGTNQSPSQPEPSTKGWVSFKAEISKEEDIVYDTCHCLRNMATIYFDELNPISTEVDIITIGDALCFSPNPNVQGETYAETLCGINVNNSMPSTRKKATGIDENISFIAYPNPFNNVFQLKGELEKIQGIEILNSLGQVVIALSGYDNFISLNNQPAGLYFIRIITEEEQEIIRVEKK